MGNTVRDHGWRRSHLTIAVSRPGEKPLCRMWRIRAAAADRKLAYPHAIELDGKLHVIHSVGIGANLNDCELAMLSVAALAVD